MGRVIKVTGLSPFINIDDRLTMVFKICCVVLYDNKPANGLSDIICNIQTEPEEHFMLFCPKFRKLKTRAN